MFAALRPAMPAKTNNAFNNPAFYEDGTASLEFHRDGQKYTMTHTIPSKESMFNPPLHLHPTQDEYFYVEKGEAFFTMPRSADKKLREGFTVNAATSSEEERAVFLPRDQYHRFNNTRSDEPLVLRVGLFEQTYDNDETFFRNFFGYLDDCRVAKVEPSVFQLMRFLYEMEAPLGVPVPGPDWLASAVSRAVCFTAGVVVGEWLLGYKPSYLEYYNPKASKM